MSATETVVPQTAQPKSATDISGTPPGTVMIREYVETVAKFAYIWGWPLVNNLNRAAAMAGLAEPIRMGVVPASPPGYVSMLTDYIDEKERIVTCPNQDTVYGVGFQRLDSIPVILQVPDFGDRFWLVGTADARTESFCGIGKQYGTKPGFYLLVGPKWEGQIPSGVAAVYRSPTDLAALLPRVFQDDTPEDKAVVQKLISQLLVYPLKEFDGKIKTKDWNKMPSLSAPAGGSGETKWVDPQKFFDQLPQAMKEVPPLPGEESLYKTIQSVLDAAQNDATLKNVLVQTATVAESKLLEPLLQFHNNGRPIGNGWTSPPNGARWGFDYLSRAASARSNMYDNSPEETRYIYTDFDSHGQRLNGAQAYVVTFKKGATPPVSGFWSLTLYNKEHLFSPNRLNRYSLGTKSKSLQVEADGSLKLYVQHDSPGADKETNWLPAPEGGDFSLYIRAYWPTAPILEGSWTPPTVQRR